MKSLDEINRTCLTFTGYDPDDKLVDLSSLAALYQWESTDIQTQIKAKFAWIWEIKMNSSTNNFMATRAPVKIPKM